MGKKTQWGCKWGCNGVAILTKKGGLIIPHVYLFSPLKCRFWRESTPPVLPKNGAYNTPCCIPKMLKNREMLKNAIFRHLRLEISRQP
jgi:hypothetical protein